MQLSNLDKQEQTKSKTSQYQQIIKIRKKSMKYKQNKIKKHKIQ